MSVSLILNVRVARCRELCWFLLLILSGLVLTACNLSSGDSSGEIATQAPSPTQLEQVLPNRTLVAINTPTSSAPVAIQMATAVPSPTPASTLVRDGISGTDSHIYVRVGPSTMSTIFTQINDLASIVPVGRTEDERWLQVRLADQRNGWIMANAITIEGDMTSLPVTGLPNYVDRVALVSAETGGTSMMRVPNGGVDIASLEPLAPLQVLGRTETTDWLFVETNTTLEGWVKTADLVLPFLPQQVQIISQNVIELTDVPSSSVVVGAPVDGADANAKVRDDAGGLRLRQRPDPDSTILFNLQAGTPLVVSERTTDNAWVYVTIPEGFEGWLATNYVEMNVEIAAIPQTDNPKTAPYFELAAPESAPSVISGVTGGARQIYLRGQQLGNRRNVFTMIGDSLTDTEMFMRGIPGGYNLREYGYLLPAIQFFNVDTGYGNAFARDPWSAEAGWVTFSTLDTNNTPTDICDPSWTPLDCEFRLIKPSVVLIMIGTNDVDWRPTSDFVTDYRRILDTTISYGVVPVISTIPPRIGREAQVNEYNQAIRQLSVEYNIPLWDFYSAVIKLSNSGLGRDGVHLSVPPPGRPGTVDFTPENLTYGTTMRNLTGLQMLKTVLEQVIY